MTNTSKKRDENFGTKETGTLWKRIKKFIDNEKKVQVSVRKKGEMAQNLISKLENCECYCEILILGKLQRGERAYYFDKPAKVSGLEKRLVETLCGSQYDLKIDDVENRYEEGDPGAMVDKKEIDRI